MPIHVNEIVVKTIVEPTDRQVPADPDPEQNQRAIVREAVERVLDLLVSRGER